MLKIVTAGEILLRLSTMDYEKIIQADRFNGLYGGGEANVAVSLASFGMEAWFVTKVPDNDLGQSAINAMRKYGVNTQEIVRGGERLGLYFLEPGVSLRSSNVIYDRKNSAISKAKAEEFDFNNIFKDADWFHISGITPALSYEAYELTKAFLTEAKKRKIKVSFDINYRSKLWTMEEASEKLVNLAPYVDVCFGSARDMTKILKIDATEENDIYNKACDTYGFSYIVTSSRKNIDSTHNKYSAKIYSKENHEFAYSPEFDMDHMVDRVGGGDAMAAGVIYKLAHDFHNYKEAVDFGVAASALKHTVHGDYNIVTAKDVENLLNPYNQAQINR